jgi:hypothetical protein
VGIAWLGKSLAVVMVLKKAQAPTENPTTTAVGSNHGLFPASLG